MTNLNLPNSIKMVITDFDGVITDGSVYVNEDKSMSRKLSFKDIMAVSLLKKSGRNLAIISGEKNSAIELIAEKFDLTEVHQGIRIKVDVIKSIVEKYNLEEDEFLYIGDDINDIASLEFAKHRITVPNAVSKVKCVDRIQITESLGGDGAFREVVDCILDA